MPRYWSAYGLGWLLFLFLVWQAMSDGSPVSVALDRILSLLTKGGVLA